MPRITRSWTIAEELWRRGRNAVAHTRIVAGEAGSYSDLVERTLRRAVLRLEETYNGGRPFASASLPTGPGWSSDGRGRAKVARITRSWTVEEDLWRRGRNAVAHTRLVPGEAGSYSDLLERALSRQVARLEKRYNGGEPFASASLPPGPGWRADDAD